MIRARLWFVLLLLAQAAPASASGDLTLSAFLEQVKRSNGDYQSAAEGAAGAAERSSEGDLVFAPVFDGTAAYMNDRSEKASPFAQGDHTQGNQYSLGISKAWSFGLTSRFAYNATYASISGAAPTAVPMPSYWAVRPTLELSLPVWGGAFGKSFRAQAQAVEASALAQSARMGFAARQILAQAEITYWRYVLARETLALERENLERAQAIQSWNARRVKLNLADNSDLYQSDALLQTRKIGLQAAIDEERSAAVAFNLARGVDSETVAEKVASSRDLSASTPKREGRRLDVEATHQEALAAQASAELARERQKPSVQVFSTLTLNGLDPTLSPAMSEAWKTQYSNSTVGVRLSVPLDFGAVSDVKSGYAREIQAAELKYQRKLFAEESEWKDLEKRYRESVRRYELVRQIEEIQRKKFQHEQQRQRSGRSTNYMVLQFEQDYATAQVNRLRAETEILTLVAQLKTFAP